MSRFITRVRLKNYKSIAACDVELDDLTFLVGVNGAGKSNFLDALRLITDALRTSLDHALRERGGINEVRRRSYGHPNAFTVRLDFQMPSGKGHFAVRVGGRPSGGHTILQEECKITAADEEYSYHVRNGVVEHFTDRFFPPPPASDDRLYLANVAGFASYRPLYNHLSHMGFYNLNPARIRDLQNPDTGDILERSGENLSSVLFQLKREHPLVVEHIEEYLAAVVPGVIQVEPINIGPKETLEFRQIVSGSKDPWRFLAANMSDGTLRVIGILTALFQSTNGENNRSFVPLVSIEEPEAALHPAAAGALRDCLYDAAQYTQIIVTSHSPDLLDDKDIPSSAILAVAAEGGRTEIAHLDFAGTNALRRHLVTAGELLRINQLAPDPIAVKKQGRLFDLSSREDNVA